MASWVWGVIGGVIGTIAITTGVILLMYCMKLGCFKPKDGAQGSMSIRRADNKVANDIEFAGQSLGQKRKSLKAMSKIVEVDEDLEDSKKATKTKVERLGSNPSHLDSV